MTRRMVLLAAAALGTISAPSEAEDARFETFEYASSHDGTKPLIADAAYLPDGKRKPLLLVMHGYSGDRRSVSRDIRELAAKGVFAVAPDMRGKGGSAGKWDSGGVELHDILDAAISAVRRFDGEIDAGHLNVVGYSGGGGNAIGCAVRFPDLFRNCISFFGISDYGWWYRSEGQPIRNQRMEAGIGGSLDQLPEAYAARNYNAAAGNARLARLHFFWDEAEKLCPPGMIEIFLETYRKSGLDNAAVHRSGKTDAVRWIHGYRGDNPHIAEPGDSLFLRDIHGTKTPPLRLPARGRLVVPGYLVTRRFQVWVGDGQSGRVTVEYHQTSDRIDLQVVDNPANHPVRLVQESPLSALP